MIEKTVMIRNVAGFQVETAGNLCAEAGKFVSSVRIRHKGTECSAKSLLSVLGAGIRFGDEITFICEGSDEEDAAAALAALAEAGFGE